MYTYMHTYLVIKLKHPSEFVLGRGCCCAMSGNQEFIEVNEIILVLVERWENEIRHHPDIILREDQGQHLWDLVLGQDAIRTVQEELPEPFPDLIFLEICVLYEQLEVIVCQGLVTFDSLLIIPLLQNHWPPLESGLNTGDIFWHLKASILVPRPPIWGNSWGYWVVREIRCGEISGGAATLPLLFFRLHHLNL